MIRSMERRKKEKRKEKQASSTEGKKTVREKKVKKRKSYRNYIHHHHHRPCCLPTNACLCPGRNEISTASESSTARLQPPILPLRPPTHTILRRLVRRRRQSQPRNACGQTAGLHCQRLPVAARPQGSRPNVPPAAPTATPQEASPPTMTSARATAGQPGRRPWRRSARAGRSGGIAG